MSILEIEQKTEQAPISIYDAQDIYTRLVNLLSEIQDPAYEILESAIQEAYEKGFRTAASKLCNIEIGNEEQIEIAALKQYATQFISNAGFETTQKMLVDMKQAIRERWTEEQYTQQLEKRIIEFQRRLDLIVRTETNRAANLGRVKAIQRCGIQWVKVYTQEDERVCRQQFEIPGIGQVQGCREFWTGRFRRTIFPINLIQTALPFHPNCRCYLVPVRQGEGGDFIVPR